MPFQSRISPLRIDERSTREDGHFNHWTHAYGLLMRQMCTPSLHRQPHDWVIGLTTPTPITA